ncbi:MAG: hypothetical protein A2X36_05440 [Elusimicrobia bacterium GWA2_69_24]|nr:MAG: hypothetical protein A2X36_05440 [Elusimicrobia bacterium GWA2_69_24]HBL16000.1 hypothetical protein [Elusimicrobiota bacterium]
MDIMIFDDDAHYAEMVYEICATEGYTVEKHPDGGRALELIRAARPRLVLLDVMMPGMDGMSICRALKGDPRLAALHVVVASAKAFPEDAEAARASGATEFMDKTHAGSRLRPLLQRLLGAAAPAAAPAPAADRPPAFQVRVWGAHGGPGVSPENPTSCVSLHFGDRLVILDAGTGLEGLCALPAPAHKEIWLLLTHYHPSHIAGLGRLGTAFGPDYTLNIAGPADGRRPLDKVLAGALSATQGRTAAKLKLFTITESTFGVLPDVQARMLFCFHPGAALGFRLTHQGRSLVYCPDNEIETVSEERIATDFAEKLSLFVRSADVLIHDAAYTQSQTPPDAGRRGHSSCEAAVDLARREGVRRLLLFHSSPGFPAPAQAGVLDGIRRKLKEDGSSLVVECAAPGMRIAV